MIRRLTTIVVTTTLILTSMSLAGNKSGIRLERVPNQPRQDIRVAPSLVTADTCFATDNKVIVFRIGRWVSGQELYKSLIDPANSCANPYPYTVVEINMPMFFVNGTSLTVSVDVEAVDYQTVPGCPVPGVVLSISKDYTLTIPAGGGMFNIWIPLDTPVVVNEPFYAGFFISNAIDTLVGAEVLTDSIPELCTSFNVWDQNVGWVDLNNNQYYNFPGRLAMEVSGIPGGAGGGVDPIPQTALLSPENGDMLYASTDLWAYDSAGSTIIDFALFEYSNGGPYVEIGRDFDASNTLRDGITSPRTGDGLRTSWNFSTLPEGTYTIRTSIVDTLGRSSQTLTTVTIEPTPPIARITTPDNGNDICPPLTAIMNSQDEDLSFVTLYRSEARMSYTANLSPMSQLSVGDANGNPADGNEAVNGEFGTYYSGPVAATVALEAWQARGVVGVVGAGAPRETVAEELALLFDTRNNLGTFDDDLFSGLKQYSINHSNSLSIDYMRDPDYFNLRQWVEEEQRIVILGLGGAIHAYITIDGFTGWQQPDSSFQVVVSNPLTGTLQILSMRKGFGYSELLFQGTWHRIDIMISLLANSWTVSRTIIGADFNGADGWSYSIQPTGLLTDSLYFLRSIARDAAMNEGNSVVLLRNSCSQSFVVGDYNNDSAADISDLFVLINFITQGGTDPVGGAARADANCDNYVNITDIVYYMNYLFGATAPPCY